MDNHHDSILVKSDYVQESWLPENLAIQTIVAFEMRFGEKHLLLTCHAALPFIVSLEMLNLITINFLDSEKIPWFAGADFLLSPLCRQIDDSLFELEPRVREVLLKMLKKRRGHDRLRDIADFLLAYLTKTQKLQKHPATMTTLRWIALSYLEPDQAVKEMTTCLQESLVSGSDQSSELLGQLLVTTTIKMIEEPLEQTTLQQEYHTLRFDAHYLAKFLYGPENTTRDEVLQHWPQIEHQLPHFSPAMQQWLLQRHTASSSTQNFSIADEEQDVKPATLVLTDPGQEIAPITDELPSEPIDSEKGMQSNPTDPLPPDEVSEKPLSLASDDLSSVASEQDRILDGDLQTVGLPSILKMLASSGKTGKLFVSSGPETLSMSLCKGQIVELHENGVAQPDILTMLCLINRLDPSRAQILREQARGDMTFAMALMVDQGLMSAYEIQRRQEFAVTQAVSRAIHWVNGRFAFHRQLVSIENRMRPLDIDSMLSEALRQADEWKQLVSEDLTFLTRTAVARWQPEVRRDVASMGLNHESIEVLCLCNGEVPLQAMATVLMSPEAHVARVMAQLLQLNLIEVVDTALETDLQQDLSNIIIRGQNNLAKRRQSSPEQNLLGMITTLSECINDLLIHHGKYARSLRGRGQVPIPEIVRYLQRRFSHPLQLLSKQQFPILETASFRDGLLDCNDILTLSKLVKGEQLEEFYWEAVQGLAAFLRTVFSELLRDEVGNSHTGRRFTVTWRVFLTEIDHEIQQYRVYRAQRVSQRSRDLASASSPETIQDQEKTSEIVDTASRLIEARIDGQSKRTVLVATSKPTLRQIIQMALHNSTTNVIVVGDGLSVLTAVAEKVPDLVLLEAQLSHMDGYTACRTIRKNSQFRQIPIILLIPSDSILDRTRVYLAGATNYLTTPFDEALLDRLGNKYLKEK